MSLVSKSLSELSSLLQSGTATSLEITEEYIKKIESEDKDINSFITKTFEEARRQAKESDTRRQKKEIKSPLDGIPITLKDVVCTEGTRTTGGSHILENYVPPYSATVWEKLDQAGCVLLGKVNTDEFTMGGSTETSAFGPTKNPHNKNHVPGGSSGGSAASVAANFCAGSIGTDTGGSIRQPAHFCGVTGLKVSYGRVSRYGVMPMASSLDTIGPIAQTAKDCAMIMDTIAGKDIRDGTTPDIAVPSYTDTLENSLEGLKIGFPQEYFSPGLNPEIQAAVQKAESVLEDMGAKMVKISLPYTEYGIAAYYIIASAEISANFSRFDGFRFGEGKRKDTLEDIYQDTRSEGFGDEVTRRILMGTYTLSSGYYDDYYRKAQKVRTLVKQDFTNAFQQVDAILCPVAPSPAFALGSHTQNPLEMYLEDSLTIPTSLAGICGLSVPVMVGKNNLPSGVQIIGDAFTEDKILNIGHKLQTAIGNIHSAKSL